MKLKRKLKEVVIKNEKLYIIAQCIRRFNDTDFVKLIKGYYEDSYSYVSILAKHNGVKYPDKVVYPINIYETVNKNNLKRSGMGFAAGLYLTLIEINFADTFGMTPVVEWGNTATYYEADMDRLTKNVFEYYFKPVSSVDYKEINDCRTVIEKKSRNGFFFMKHNNGYATEQDEVEKLGYLFKKYICLNAETKRYIEMNLKKIICSDTVLAVHVRGTDFNVGFKDHPRVIAAEEYLAKTKELYDSHKYTRIFLATDDINALELFKNEFKDELLYYADTFRSENSVGPHNTPSNRSMHYYKLGLEVLRDIFTLANCDSLICGLSGVAFAARYVNLALDRKFEEVIILDKGIN